MKKKDLKIVIISWVILGIIIFLFSISTDNKQENTIASTNIVNEIENEEQKDIEKKSDNIYIQSIREKPVMNGFNTERIGTQGYIKIDKKIFKKEFDHKKFLEFTKELKNRKYNSFFIVFEDDTALFATPGLNLWEYTRVKLDTSYYHDGRGIGNVEYKNGKWVYAKY